MLLVLLGIVALICMICAGIKNKSAEKIEIGRATANMEREKYRDDCLRKRDSIRYDLRQKYYNSSVTREIADYFLAGKSSAPLYIDLFCHDLTALYSDGTSIKYCFLEHGLADPVYKERIDPPYESPYKKANDSWDYTLEFNPQHEFCDALQQVISEQYGVGYAFEEPDPFDYSTKLIRVPTRQF